MSWFQKTAAETESLKPDNLLAIAIDGDFPSGHLRLSTFLQSFDLGGDTFFSSAGLGSIPQVSENTQLVADTRTYQLSGIDPAVIPESEIDACFGRSWKEYLVWLDLKTHQVIDYELNFEGRMDKVDRKDGSAPTVQVSVEHRLAILDEADGWCYTDQHQKNFYAGDKGLDQVAMNNSVEITWGGGKANFPGQATSIAGGLLRGAGGTFQR
jgi:hypothetical protein